MFKADAKKWAGLSETRETDDIPVEDIQPTETPDEEIIEKIVTNTKQDFWSRLMRAFKWDKTKDNPTKQSASKKSLNITEDNSASQTITLWGEEIQVPIDELWNVVFPEAFIQKNNARKSDMALGRKQENFDKAKKELETINSSIVEFQNKRKELQDELNELKKAPEPQIKSLHFSFLSSEKISATAQELKDISDSMVKYALVKAEQEKIQGKIDEIDATLLWTSEVWWKHNEEWLKMKKETAEIKKWEMKKNLGREQNYRAAQRIISQATGGIDAYENEKIDYEEKKIYAEKLQQNIQIVSDFIEKWDKWTMEQLAEVNAIAQNINFSWDTSNPIGLKDLNGMLAREEERITKEIQAYDTRELQLSEAHKAIDIYNYFELQDNILEAKWEIQKAEENYSNVEDENQDDIIGPKEKRLWIKLNRVWGLLELKRKKKSIKTQIEDIKIQKISLWQSLRWTISTLWEIETIIILGNDVDIVDINEPTTREYLISKWIERLSIPTARKIVDEVKSQKKSINKRIDAYNDKLTNLERNLKAIEQSISTQLKDRSEIRTANEEIKIIKEEWKAKIEAADEIRQNKTQKLHVLESSLTDNTKKLEEKYKVSIKQLLSQEIDLSEENSVGTDILEGVQKDHNEIWVLAAKVLDISS